MACYAWLAVLVVMSAASVKAPAWKSPRTLKVTYAWDQRNATADQDEGARAPAPPKATYTVWYQSPASYRAESVTTEEGHPPYLEIAAVGNAWGMRVYSPLFGTGAWTPADDAMLPSWIPDVQLAGTAGPFASFQEELADRLRSAQAGGGEVQLLPDETVAGRPCMVLKMRWHTLAPAPEGLKEVVETDWEWVDKEYGIPLAWKHAGEDGSFVGTRATSVQIDAALESEVFTLHLPEGVHVFKGPFAPEEADDAVEAFSLANDTEKDASDHRPPALSRQHGALTVLWPRAVPPGFVSVLKGYSDDDAPGGAWYISAILANWKTGGVIVFKQGTSADVVCREKPDREDQMNVRKSPARVLHLSQPYAHLALEWQSGGVRYSLEGSEVTVAELRAMAEGMEQVSLSPKEVQGAERPR
jgi:hypothetical protein